MKSAVQPALVPGIYAAIPTFFGQDETLDLETLEAHVTRLVQAGIAGVVTLGSNGEAVHLTSEEKKLVTSRTRQVMVSAGRGDMPVVVGSSAQSVAETVQLCRDAAEAGGSHVLVLPPSYYKAAMTPKAIHDFYIKVADASPLPLVVYSYPAVVSDINLSSDQIIAISQHPNIVGTKFTCGDTGKLARVARAMSACNGGNSPSYWAVGGLADFILQAMLVGGSGVIAGTANLFPKVCIEVFRLTEKGMYKEAMALQADLAEADWAHTVLGIGATKAALQHFYGYGGAPRLPLVAPPTVVVQELSEKLARIVALENSL
ncbi:uncharacterized protein Z520_09107 [Fonsecaea multimorphosa CBS 102226]|uniref:4-hydroxy-2-oxoglutarate aldolase, mitochondrial n=1 Tax=Fonsecaea multimorphosa CBS 102226 TaxID=1442371 RepID=A0A0D2IDH6_9EURO|nr:uncharacterized protein Z520_09107 [Fonsecaea multimorphosa CBS 102226]KIX95191.1 hypothetical protein Z520_09107 [Fonsecaea multimorphosa CBS 102226]OAL20907.1 hypothetical protein AYO22_08535 [Fonsecaea multimorphosa]